MFAVFRLSGYAKSDYRIAACFLLCVGSTRLATRAFLHHTSLVGNPRVSVVPTLRPGGPPNLRPSERAPFRFPSKNPLQSSQLAPKNRPTAPKTILRSTQDAREGPYNSSRSAGRPVATKRHPGNPGRPLQRLHETASAPNLTPRRYGVPPKPDNRPLAVMERLVIASSEQRKTGGFLLRLKVNGNRRLGRDTDAVETRNCRSSVHACIRCSVYPRTRPSEIDQPVSPGFFVVKRDEYRMLGLASNESHHVVAAVSRAGRAITGDELSSRQHTISAQKTDPVGPAFFRPRHGDQPETATKIGSVTLPI